MRPRLLVAGHAGVSTGYARVLGELLPRLTDAFDVTLFAFNWKSAGLPDQSVRTRTNALIGDVLGKDQLPALLEEIQPDVVLLHHDADYYAVHARALDEYRARRPGARVVVYCPIEWEATPSQLLATLEGADAVVPYTSFGERLVRAALGPASTTPVVPIGHGASPDVFHPLAEDVAQGRSEARRRLFPDRPELEGAFVVLNANRNSPRKRIDLTLRAFAELAAGKEDVYLCLHMGLADSGIDVPREVTRLGLGNRVLATTSERGLPGVTDEHLNLVYNAADVGLNTATGEGWGLVAFEHGATRAAQVMPEHSACAELWRDKALLVALEPGREDEGIVSLDATVAALERLYANEGLRDRLGASARAHALDPRFDWDTIAQSWKSLLLKEAHLARSP